MSISNLEDNNSNLDIQCNSITANSATIPGIPPVAPVYNTNLTGMIPVTALPFQINKINGVCYFKSAASFFGPGANSASGQFSLTIDPIYRPTLLRKVIAFITAGIGSTGTTLYPLFISITTSGTITINTIDGTNTSSGTNYYFPGLEFSYTI